MMRAPPQNEANDELEKATQTVKENVLLFVVTIGVVRIGKIKEL